MPNDDDTIRDTNADFERGYAKAIKDAASLIKVDAAEQFLAGLDREAIASRALAARVGGLGNRLC